MIGIIGGSGLDSFEELNIQREQTFTTTWGEPSATLKIGNLNGVDVAFLARHGDNHELPPHKVNYRANIAALRELGVQNVIAVNAVGGIEPGIKAGDIVIPDQLIDYTWGREHTFSDGTSAPLQHIDFTFPFSVSLRAVLANQLASMAADDSELAYRTTATCAVTQGPRLETAAEIYKMAKDGCHIVGMTSMPEAALAREAGLDYASVALVVNAAAGVEDKLITLDDISAIINDRMPVIRRVLMESCRAITG